MTSDTERTLLSVTATPRVVLDMSIELTPGLMHDAESLMLTLADVEAGGVCWDPAEKEVSDWLVAQGVLERAGNARYGVEALVGPAFPAFMGRLRAALDDARAREAVQGMGPST